MYKINVKWGYIGSCIGVVIQDFGSYILISGATSVVIVICIKQHLRNILSSVHEKVKQH